jgi:type IV pilus assembly protein PilB
MDSLKCIQKFLYGKENQILFPNYIKKNFYDYPINLFYITPLFVINNILYVICDVNNSVKNQEDFKHLYIKDYTDIIIIRENSLHLYWKDDIKTFINTNYFNLNKVLSEGLSYKFVSDLHFISNQYNVVIKVRASGVMIKVGEMSTDDYKSIIFNLKRISGLDIFNKTSPQSGSSTWYYEGQEIFIRSSFHPCVFSEKVAIRFLNSLNKINKLEDLGMSLESSEKLRSLCNKPGLVICSGSTGAGKTTTVYTILKELSNIGKKIITVEDPVEFYIPQICQTDASMLSYEECIKSALRQDIDVLFVGEIRDDITAKYVMRAAMTGHLVLTTMHLGSSQDAINRLVEMGN